MCRPQFQILGAIVVALSILVVNILTLDEWATKHLLHDNAVLVLLTKAG